MTVLDQSPLKKLPFSRLVWLIAAFCILADCASEHVEPVMEPRLQAEPADESELLLQKTATDRGSRNTDNTQVTLNRSKSVDKVANLNPTAPRASEQVNEGAEDFYQQRLDTIELKKQEWRRSWPQSRKDQAEMESAIETVLVQESLALSQLWLGTRWGLGAPQIRRPGPGKINCGTFVGTILSDLGFVVNVRKLQRQPSQQIIASFVSGDRSKKLPGRSMSQFLSEVRTMGPGLFIVGLDFHVGFLVQTDSDLRFIHASFETGTVVNESAANAMPLVASRYRALGKILSRENVRDWLWGRTINVHGNK